MFNLLSGYFVLTIESYLSTHNKNTTFSLFGRDVVLGEMLFLFGRDVVSLGSGM